MDDEREAPKANRDCAGCGRWMVSQRRWWAMPIAERHEVRAEMACHGTDDLCKSCIGKAKRREQKEAA